MERIRSRILESIQLGRSWVWIRRMCCSACVRISTWFGLSYSAWSVEPAYVCLCYEKYKEIKPTGRINDLEAVIAETLGVDQTEALDKLYALMDDVLQSEPLKNFGVKEEDLPVFAKDVANTQLRLLKNNYIPLSEEQLLEIYKAAF